MKLILDTGQERLEFPLPPGKTLIGREPKCDIQIEHPKVSREHLECIVEGDTLTIRDLGSRNGTFLNDEKVGEARLRQGDHLRLGTSVHLVFDESPAADTATPAITPSERAVQHQPHRPMAPGAPTVETEAPSEPEVDQEEAPTPEGETALPAHYTPADAGQPPDARIVQRMGRWYAVDPATGREVEIMPVGVETAATGGKVSLWERFKSLRPVPKAALVLCVVLIVAVVGAQVAKPKPKKGIRAPIKRTQYNQLLDDAVEQLQKNDIEGAERILAKLQKAVPGRTIAPMLVDVCQIWVDLHGKNFPQVREEAEERFAEISDSEYSTLKVRTFANKQLQFIASENRTEGHLFRANELAAKKDYERAFDLYARIPKGSLYYAQVEKKIGELKDSIVAAAVEEGDRSMADQKWEEAVESYRKAKRYESEIPDVDKKMQTCQLNALDRDRLAKAQKARDKEQWAQVAMYCDGIRPAGPYGGQAAELRRLVKAKGTLVEATGLYNQGEGPRALSKLRGLTDVESVGLGQRIELAMRYLEKGNKAAEEQRFQDAEAYWQEVLRVEKTEANHYRREAERRIASWKARAKSLAQQYMVDGNKKYAAQDYKGARQLYEKAKATDPEKKIGQGQIDQLAREARSNYYRGIAYAKTDPKRALLHFQSVTQMLLPGETLYQQAINEIEALK